MTSKDAKARTIDSTRDFCSALHGVFPPRG
jgi:hypothetical protein